MAPERSASTNMEDMSANVLREPKEILTLAVESSTSVSPALVDLMLDATAKEELTGQFHLHSFGSSPF